MPCWSTSSRLGLSEGLLFRLIIFLCTLWPPRLIKHKLNMRRRLAAGNILSPAPPSWGNSPLQQFSALAPLACWLGNDGVGPLGRGSIRAGSSGSSTGCRGDPSDAAWVRTAQRRSRTEGIESEGGRTNKQTDRQAATLHFLLSSGKLHPDGAEPIGGAGCWGSCSNEDTPPFCSLAVLKRRRS